MHKVPTQLPNPIQPHDHPASMSDARTMTRYLVNDKWKEAVELQLQINNQAPSLIAATESRMLVDIRAMITDRRAAHGHAVGQRVEEIMNVVQAPFELSDLPDELHPLFQTRVLFYAFIIGFMHNGMLVFYCETALRAFPDPDARPERKYAYIVREIMYLAMLRLDSHARQHLTETSLEQYSSVVAMIMGAHPDLSTDGLRPLPVDAHDRLCVDDSMEAMGVPTPSLGAAWRMSEATRCEEVIRRWGEDIGMRQEMDATQRNRFSRHLNMAPVDIMVESVRSNTPPYLGGYAYELQTTLSNVIACLGHFLTHRDNIIYDILASYRVIHLCNPAVTPLTAAGMCVHMTFFTYTHLRMCLEGLSLDLAREAFMDFDAPVHERERGRVNRNMNEPDVERVEMITRPLPLPLALPHQRPRQRRRTCTEDDDNVQ